MRAVTKARGVPTGRPPPGPRRTSPAGASASAAVGGPDAEGRRIVAEGAAELGVPLDGHALERIETYLDLLQRWGRIYNLTAILDRPAMRVQHVLDSLALVPHLPPPRSPGEPPSVLLDVGSGAGLPGVIVAIAQPARRVVCVDTVGKKVGFIRQVAAELRLPELRAIHARVEALRGDRDWQAWAPQGADQVVSRAFASLVDFLDWTRDLPAAGGEWLALKGQVPADEIAQVSAPGGPGEGGRIEVLPLRVPGLEAQRCLVRVRRSGDVPRGT